MSKDNYENYKIKSSEESINEFFKKSTIWKDIKGLALDGIEDLRTNLEDIKRTNDESLVIRGMILKTRNLVDLQTEMLQTKQVQDETAALEAAQEEKEN